MTLSLYDSYRRRKVPFVPQDPSRITIYSCGPTVYSAPHIGNARAAVVADTLVRHLGQRVGRDKIVFARNLTDIDDKIINAARDEGVGIGTITARATDAYHADLAALGCEPPDIEPRATDNIEGMQALISTLIERGHAYVAEGHVLFDAGSFDRYGGLSGLSRDDIVEGARVEVAPYKRDAADFVLWKPSAEDQPGWPAPQSWGLEGNGRPGWHIECSAMIRAVLGETIDIHLGGQDLRFPHHENEIAQSCCAMDTGDVPLARYWVHNGMLRLGTEKMSKSKGNIQTPADLLKTWPGEVLRMALLSAQYRQPLEWDDALLTRTKAQLDRFYRAIERATDAPAAPAPKLLDALDDDLNTPQAIAVLHELREGASQGLPGLAETLRASARHLGLLEMSPSLWFRQGADDGPSDAEIDALIEERQAARKAKDFARADAIRDELAEKGVILEDSAGGVTWRRG